MASPNSNPNPKPSPNPNPNPNHRGGSGGGVAKGALAADAAVAPVGGAAGGPAGWLSPPVASLGLQAGGAGNELIWPRQAWLE